MASLRAFTAFMSTLDRAADGHAVVRGAARQVRRIGARDQRLGRGAAGIDAGAAEKLALDDGDLPACGHQPPRQRGSGLPGADDDRVIVRHDRPPVCARRSTKHARQHQGQARVWLRINFKA